ncbi:MAG TPA: CHAT domain-containing protein [Thermoanaerobaculia bacterium]|nr:CHAT domain-containing protein [Thermoanaerobaculia bacterium]
MNVARSSERPAAYLYAREQRTRYAAGASVAIAVLLLVSGIVAWRRFDDPIARLSRQGVRPSEFRLTALAYAPKQKPGPAMQNAALRIAREHARHPERKDALSFGIARWSLGDFPASAQSFAKAASAQNDPRVWSDLAAAQLAAGELETGTELALRACELDPTSTAAAFNCALALQKLGIRSQALRAWDRVLQLETDPGWRGEAGTYLRALQHVHPSWSEEQEIVQRGESAAAMQQVLADHAQRVRFWFITELLPRVVASGDAHDVKRASWIARERTAAGDAFLDDVLAGALACRTCLATSLKTLVDARAATRERRMDAAVSLYDSAIEGLRRNGSPLVFFAAVFAASNDFYRGEDSRALERLDAVDRELAEGSGRRYPSIVAESLWVRSLILGRSGDGREIGVLQRARQEAERAHEADAVLALDTLLVSASDRSGRSSEAAPYRLSALRQIDRIGVSDERLATFYLRCALTALRLRRPHLSLAFLNAVLEIAFVKNDALLLADTLGTRALALHESGKSNRALASVAAARRAAERIETQGLRERATSDLEFIAGLVMLPHDPSGAAARFSTSLRTWRERGWRIRSARALLARGTAYRDAGNDVAAEIDYRAGIEEMEGRRHSFREPEWRVSFFEESGDLFEELVRLLIDRGRYAEAFEVADRRRARSLRDRMFEDARIETIRTRDIAAALPANRVTIEYALLQRSVAIWLIRRDRVVFVQRAIPRRDLAKAAGEFRTAILRNDQQAMARQGQLLFRHLLEPLLPEIPPRAHLVIVPDAELSSVPFAALRRGNGRYLIEDFVITYGASAAVRADSPDLHAPLRSVVAVAAEGGGSLARLPRVLEEARAVAALYERATLLDGRAGIGEFLARAAKSDVVHFAGHAEEESLVFSSATQAERLDAKTIAGSIFSRRPLVVLAACGTATGPVLRNEGVDSLAVAFLHAGARGVVATLWDAEDESMTRISQALHQRVRGGTPPAEALREVQLSMIRGTARERAPARWASMVLIGNG